MNDNVRASATAIGAASVVGIICTLGYAVILLAGVPQSFGALLPNAVAGIFLITLGSMWVLWVFVFRKPKDFLVSTFYTFRKAVKGEDLSSSLGRSEPFITDGPYLYVRNPTYFAAVVVTLGIGFARTDFSAGDRCWPPVMVRADRHAL